MGHLCGMDTVDGNSLGKLMPPGKMGLPCGSAGKESTCNAGDRGSIPGLEGSPGEGNGNPIQYSCLEDPIDRGVWQDAVHGVANSQKQLSMQEKNKRVENCAVISIFFFSGNFCFGRLHTRSL